VAEMDLEDKRPKEALGYAIEALQIDPVNSKGRLLLVRALQLSGRIAEAKSELAMLLRDVPNFRAAQMQMGYLQLDEGRYREAEVSFRNMLRPGQEDTQPLAGLAEVYFRQKQPSKALEIVQAELQLKPESSRMRLLLAELASRSGDDNLALQQYLHILNSGVRTAGLYESIAELQFRKGRLADAIDSLRNAQALEPGRTDLIVLLGGLIEQTGHVEEARALYRQALQQDPQNTIAMNNLAYNLAESGEHLDEALDLATKASRAASDPNFADTLGLVYLKKNMTEGAVQVFRNLVQKQPGNPTYRLHLGMALLANGDRAVARQELQKALSNKPSARESADIRTLLMKVGG
jgi:Flp pilus assembly protein TadD